MPTAAVLALLAAATGPSLHREVLPGGLELLVVPVEGASTASLRYVIRSGSLSDPAGREGLAHLLEHLLIRGAPGEVGLIEEARASGATLNAYTSHQTTTYVLDAPAGAFGPLAERFLRAVTDPALPAAQVERELDVVGREETGGGPGVFAFLENVLYRDDLPRGTTLGDGGSRRRVSRADLLEFFRREYATSNSAVVLTGAVSVESARQLLDRAFLLPPALPGEYQPLVPASPTLPVSEKLRSPRIAVVVGYALAPEDRPLCEPIARLAGLRAFLELSVHQPLASSVVVGCATFRGADFVMAMGAAPSLDATELPEALERSLLQIASRPPSERERRQLTQRGGRALDRLLQSPAALAEALANAAARPLDRQAEAERALQPPALPYDAMRAVARRAFLPERRVLIQLSPFEG